MKRWPSGVRALRHREFRVLWLGLVISAVGTWMQIVAQSLLVLQLSHGSPFALGCVSLCQACAFFLFALVGGGFADRWNRLRLLVITQACLMLLAMLLGLLTVMHLVTVPIIAAAAFASGVVLSFDQPARAALVSTVVPKEDLLNAISLQSAVFNGASIVGPAIAGLVVSWVGLAADFFLNALSFTGVLAGLAMLSTRAPVAARRDKLIRQIQDALASVSGDKILLAALVVYAVLLFAGPSQQLLLPVLANTRLHLGPAMLGLLFSAAGVGAVIGAVLLGTMRAATGRVTAIAVALWGAALVSVGASTQLPLTFLALVVMGAAQSAVGATTATLLQTRVPPEQRGRVMSVNTLLVMGLRPLGDFPVGAMIAAVGAPVTTAVSAMVVGIAGVGALIAMASPRDRTRSS